MRAVHLVNLDALARAFGNRDESLVRRVLSASDEFTRERLAGCSACGFDAEATLRAIVAGDVSALDPGAVLQMLDVVVHQFGTEPGFLDETWATDAVLTALDKSKVNFDRGLGAPLPWPIERSATGVPSVSVWSTADLETLSREIESARAKVAPELAEKFAAVARAVNDLIATGKQVIAIDWL